MPFTAPNAPNTSTAQARRSSLADALFTSTQQRVLAPLFGQPGKSFFVTQIMELANSGRGAVQRELERLLAGGLVTVTMMGTQKHYQANPDSPLFNELCGMIQKTVGLAEPIREALESMKEDVDLALIFGSVAKATDSSSSDIDVLIVAEGITLEAAYAALIPVEEMLVRRISPKLYAPDEFRNRRDEGNAFLERVLDGPVIVLIGSLDGA
ncbi:MAG: nucleotidyltransferase domain-containing protein [Proteobacteria bacterium]|nr:nucleotidyltransferase domain-containing protein [Pseudomonadota bacterium]